MRKTLLLVLLPAAMLLAMGSLAIWAQVIDATPCQSACYDAKTQCVTECGQHPNPVECEADCHDELTDCLKEC